MQVTLKQAEIEAALQSYIVEEGVNVSGKQVNVSLIAGRGSNGMSAVIDIDAIGSEVDTENEVAIPENESVVESVVNEETPIFGNG